MSDLSDVYNDLIMEHSMNSYNKKHLDNPDFCEIGHNPNCGDEITLELKIYLLQVMVVQFHKLLHL